MKLRYYLGLSLRIYFGIILFVCPFAAFFFCLFLHLSGLSFNVSCIIFVCLFIFIGIKIYKIKCPKCNTRLIETYRVGSKYYRGGFHKVPKTCPCCGLNLDEV